MEIEFNCSNDKIVAYLVYQPAGHIINDFFVDFENLLIESQMCSGKKNCLGDFNVWMDQQKSVDANKFRSVLNSFGLKNHVKRLHIIYGILLILSSIVLKTLYLGVFMLSLKIQSLIIW